MDLKNSPAKILIFYRELEEDSRFNLSVESLASRSNSQLTGSFERLVAAGSAANKQSTYRYISKESLVALSDLIKDKCERDCKFIVFGEVNRQAKDSFPVFLWRHVELFTNHIDRVFEYVAKQVTAKKEQVKALQHFVLFGAQRSAELVSCYDILRAVSGSQQVGCFSEEAGSSPKFMQHNKVYGVTEMQHFSKLYLLSKQLQVKCQLAFVVLADNVQPKEIEKRMTDMYKVEFRVFNNRAELCDFLLELKASGKETKEFVVEAASIRRIYKVGNALPSAVNKYISIVEAEELSELQANVLSQFSLVLTEESNMTQTAKRLASFSKEFILVTQDMVKNARVSFNSGRNVQVLVAANRMAGQLLQSICYSEYELSHIPQLLATIMLDRFNVPQVTLDKLEQGVFANTQIIKVFTNGPGQRLVDVLSSVKSKNLDNLFFYQGSQFSQKHVTRKDFVLLNDIKDVRLSEYSSRVLLVRECPLNTSSNMIQLGLKEVPYYMKRQKELEQAYRQYSQIININKLGVFLLNASQHWKMLAKRIAYNMKFLNVSLEIVEESDPIRMRNIMARTNNELNLIVIEQSLLKGFEQAEKSSSSSRGTENLEKSVWQNPEDKPDLAQLFTHDYRFLAALTEAIRQHNRKFNQTPDYINVRIFSFENATISQYLQQKLHKKKVYFYDSCSQLLDVMKELKKGVKEIIFMSLDGFTQEMENRIQEIYRQQMICFEVILVTPMAYILKTFHKNKTHYSFLSEKELKQKIDQFKSLKEQDTVAEGALLEKLQVQLKDQQLAVGATSTNEDSKSSKGLEKGEKGAIGELSRTTDKSDTPSKCEKSEPKQEMQYSPSKYLQPISAVSIDQEKQETMKQQASDSKEEPKQLCIEPTVVAESSPLQHIIYLPHEPLLIQQDQSPAQVHFYSRLLSPVKPMEPVGKPVLLIIPIEVRVVKPESPETQLVITPALPKDDNLLSNDFRTIDELNNEFQQESQNREPSPIQRVEDANKTQGEKLILDQLTRSQTLKAGPQLRRPTKRTSVEKSSKLVVKFVQIKPKNGRSSSEGTAQSLQKINLDEVMKLRKKLNEKRAKPGKLGLKKERPQHPAESEYLLTEPKLTLTSSRPLEDTRKSSNFDFQRITGTYSAQKITNYRILKSRSPKPLSQQSSGSSRPASAFRSTLRQQATEIDDDPFETFRRYHCQLKQKLSRQNKLEIFIPIQEEQLCKNLKCRLSKTSQTVLKGYFEMSDISLTQGRSIIIISTDANQFRQLPNVTWFFVRTKNNAVQSSSAYYFPNIPYTEEFIAELFALQESEPAPLRKSAQRRIYILYKSGQSTLAEAARGCQRYPECKVRAYKQGSLGLCLSSIGINNDILLLTSQEAYDQQAYAVYSLRKNIEIVGCKQGIASQRDTNSDQLSKKIQQLIANRAGSTAPAVQLTRSCSHLK